MRSRVFDFARSLAVAATVIALSAAVAVAQTPEPGLELPDHTGRLQNLRDYRGKIVVLNFWATWCAPCTAEMPIFVELHRRFAARGVVVLAASLDTEETKGNIPQFMQKRKMEFPVLVGTTVEHMQPFGVGDALPATVFLDAEGRIVGRILGEARKKDVLPRVEWLLGDRRGKEPEPVVNHFSKSR